MLDSIRKLVMGNPLTAVAATAVVSGGIGYYLGSPSESDTVSSNSSEKKDKKKKKKEKKESEN